MLRLVLRHFSDMANLLLHSELLTITLRLTSLHVQPILLLLLQEQGIMLR